MSLLKLLPAIIMLQMLDALCFPVTRYGTQIIEPFTFAFYRFVISTVVLLSIAWRMKPQRPIERRDWRRIILLAI
ncbi:MAG: EamA family transporter, partial [Candidatus Zixiibacteriota bacterium]